MHPGTIVLIVIGSVGVLWGSYEIGYRLLDWVSYRRDQKKYEEYLRQYYEKHQSQTNDNIMSSPQLDHFDEKKDKENNNDNEDDDYDDDDDVPLAYHPSLRRRKIFNKENEDIIKESEKEMENYFLQQRGNSIMGIFNDNDKLDDFDDRSMYLLKKSTIESPPTYQEVDSPSSMILVDESMEKRDISSSPVVIDNDSNDNNNNNNDDVDDETLVLITNDTINNINNNNNNEKENSDKKYITQQQQQSDMINDQSISQSVYLTPQQESESGNSLNSLSQDSWTSLVPSSSSDSLSSPNLQQNSNVNSNNNNSNNNSNNSLSVYNDDMASSLSSTSSFSVISISDDDLKR